MLYATINISKAKYYITSASISLEFQADVIFHGLSPQFICFYYYFNLEFLFYGNEIFLNYWFEILVYAIVLSKDFILDKNLYL